MAKKKTRLTDGALAAAFAAADEGSVFETTFTPLSNLGNVAVTYNWLYSALNAAPGYGDNNIWVVNKLSESEVSLSPKYGWSGMTLYASVRDDWYWNVQCQAPHSADWITAVGRNETIGFEPGQLTVASFKGWNGAYLALQSAWICHGSRPGDDHCGRRITSNGGGLDNNTRWHMGIQAVTQSKLDLPVAADLTSEDYEAILRAHGAPADAGAVERLIQAGRVLEPA